MKNKDVYSLKSNLAFALTLEHLKDEIKKRGNLIFAELDHRQNAAEVGMNMPESTVLIFGSPKAGTPLMLENPAIALELPLKIAVWEDHLRQVWIGYKDVTAMAAAYDVCDHPTIRAMRKLLHDIVHDAVRPSDTLQEGCEVYFLVSGYVMKGKVMNLQQTGSSYTFSIEGYGGCGGNHIIIGDQLHRRVFLSEKEAEQYKEIEQMYLEGHC